MRGTLILLCILLILWIGGSSYWYMCKINDHCSPMEAVSSETSNQGDTSGLSIENPKVDEIGKDISIKDSVQFIEEDSLKANEDPKEVESKTSSVVDSISIVREYIQKNSSRTINFKYAKYETLISEEDSVFLEMLRIFIENEPEKMVYVTGHSDSIGTPEGLVFASYQRVVFMAGALVDAGIPKALIKTKSMGNSTPVASDSTREGRGKNRRVEISVRNL